MVLMSLKVFNFAKNDYIRVSVQDLAPRLPDSMYRFAIAANRLVQTVMAVADLNQFSVLMRRS